MFLSKQLRTVFAGRQKNVQTIEVLGAYTLLGKPYGNLVRQATLPEAKRPLYMGSGFLGRHASITIMDLI